VIGVYHGYTVYIKNWRSTIRNHEKSGFHTNETIMVAKHFFTFICNYKTIIMPNLWCTALLVPLSWVTLHIVHSAWKFKQKSCKELFKSDSCDGKLFILIERSAGTGKTTLAQNVCKKWSSGDMFTGYSFVVLICLRDQKPGGIKETKDLFTYCKLVKQQVIFTLNHQHILQRRYIVLVRRMAWITWQYLQGAIWVHTASHWRSVSTNSSYSVNNAIHYLWQI